MQGRFLRNVIARHSTAIFELFSCKYNSLLVRRDALLVLDHDLQLFHSRGGVNLNINVLACQSLNYNGYGPLILFFGASGMNELPFHKELRALKSIPLVPLCLTAVKHVPELLAQLSVAQVGILPLIEEVGVRRRPKLD